jgi:hypothetical protein
MTASGANLKKVLSAFRTKFGFLEVSMMALRANAGGRRKAHLAVRADRSACFVDGKPRSALPAYQRIHRRAVPHGEQPIIVCRSY